VAHRHLCGEMLIRVRRLPRRVLRRRMYEVEFIFDGSLTRREVTSSPVPLIDGYLGLGDAWALVRAADKAWSGDVGQWVASSTTESRWP
jgi:hypothetical protein